MAFSFDSLGRIILQVGWRKQFIVQKMSRHEINLVPREENALKEIYCCFVTKPYPQQWLSCMNPIEALFNNIIFLRKL